MGGNAFKNLERLSPSQYELAKFTVYENLSSRCKNFNILRSLYKDSYGDIDVFVDSSCKVELKNSPDLTIIQKISKNGIEQYLVRIQNSFDVQVDLNYTDNLNYSLNYYSYNGINLLFSIVAKFKGYKLTSKGLYKEYSRKTLNKKTIIERYLVSDNFSVILSILGFDFCFYNNLKTFEDVIKFIKRNKDYPDFIQNVFGKDYENELFQFFKKNEKYYDHIKPNSHNEFKFNTQFLNQKIHKEIKRYKGLELENQRFNFKRVKSTYLYLLNTNQINSSLDNKELGNIIKIAKEKYFQNPLNYSSRALFSILIINSIKSYCKVISL